jgi:hypothetical protein
MGWVVNATPRPLYPLKTDPVPIIQEDGWTPGPVWTGAENLTPTGTRSPDRPHCSVRLEMNLHENFKINYMYIYIIYILGM